MEQTLENYDMFLKYANMKTANVVKSNKCNQCDYASSHSGNFRNHLKTHSHCVTVEKSQTNATNATMHPLRSAI